MNLLRTVILPGFLRRYRNLFSVAVCVLVSLNLDAQIESCSDLSFDQTADIYFVPFPEDQIYNQFDDLINPDNADCDRELGDQVQTYLSISIIEEGTVIHYDHWEDGYEFDITNPAQFITTEIWGDGNPINGIPPGYAVDFLPAGSVIIMNNAVNPAAMNVLDYDGRDKFASFGGIAFSRLGWPAIESIRTLAAGAVEVLPQEQWGTSYEMPVGECDDVHEMFEYTGITIMAGEDNTQIQIDYDGNGTADLTTTLDQGQSWVEYGGICAGAVVTGSNPIQVDMFTGDICATFESRWFMLSPTDSWSNDYYNPVSTAQDPNNPATHAPTYVHVYNPSNNPIVVDWETQWGNQPDINVPGNGTAWVEVPVNTGSHFFSNSPFYALATIDSEPHSNGQTNSRTDWGYALIPQSQLTPEIATVGYAPGSWNPATGLPEPGQIASPVWITVDHIDANNNTPILICVDYNGDGGTENDMNGLPYDEDFLLTPLQQQKLSDPSDDDMTATKIWVCDNSYALIAGAYGQDPLLSTVGDGDFNVDLGTALPNGIPFEAFKCVRPSNDIDGDSAFDVCEDLTYSIQVINRSPFPYPANTFNILDVLDPTLSYLPNTTYIGINGPNNFLPDQTSGTPYSLDEGGLTANYILPAFDTLVVEFDASVISFPVDSIVHNLVTVTSPRQTLDREMSFAVEPDVLIEAEDLILSCSEAFINEPQPGLIVDIAQGDPGMLSFDTDKVPGGHNVGSGSCALIWEPNDFEASDATFTFGPFDLSTYAGVNMFFDYNFEDYAGNGDFFFEMWDGNAWNTVFCQTHDDNGNQYTGIDPVAIDLSNVPTNLTDCPATVGTTNFIGVVDFQFRFRYTSTDVNRAWGLGIDDILLTDENNNAIYFENFETCTQPDPPGVLIIENSAAIQNWLNTNVGPA